MSDTLDLNSPTEIMRALVHEDSYRAAMTTVGNVLASEAKSRAPVEHGDYRDGIHGQVWSDSDGHHVALVGDNFKTVFIEKGVHGAGAGGNVNFPAHRVFLLSAQSLGLNMNEASG